MIWMPLPFERPITIPSANPARRSSSSPGQVGWRQDGLHVLHVVLFPRYKYDLPILAMDVVVMPGGRVSLAVIDACPVNKNMTLPPHYMQVRSGPVGLIGGEGSNPPG